MKKLIIVIVGLALMSAEIVGAGTDQTNTIGALETKGRSPRSNTQGIITEGILIHQGGGRGEKSEISAEALENRKELLDFLYSKNLTTFIDKLKKFEDANRSLLNLSGHYVIFVPTNQILLNKDIDAQQLIGNHVFVAAPKILSNPLLTVTAEEENQLLNTLSNLKLTDEDIKKLESAQNRGLTTVTITVNGNKKISVPVKSIHRTANGLGLIVIADNILNQQSNAQTTTSTKNETMKVQVYNDSATKQKGRASQERKGKYHGKKENEPTKVQIYNKYQEEKDWNEQQEKKQRKGKYHGKKQNEPTKVQVYNKYQEEEDWNEQQGQKNKRKNNPRQTRQDKGTKMSGNKKKNNQSAKVQNFDFYYGYDDYNYPDVDGDIGY